MWWPMLNPLPEYQTLSDIKKLGYMFANGILLTPACALIILRQPVICNVYGSGRLDESDGTMCTSGHFIRFKYNGIRIFALDASRTRSTNWWYHNENCPGNSVRYNYRLCIL